ncbi:MAG TPA: nuclear transport factor 2 family protein [Herpetosiphonaceae bacterium]
MAASAYDLVASCFAAIESKDLAAVLSYFADDAVLIDPHYPNPHMVGKPAIAEGLAWAFATLERLNFRIVNFFAAEDGHSIAIETATAHMLPGGRSVRLTQIFVIVIRDGLVVRLQAYTPYGPNGLAALLLGLMRLWRRLTRSRRSPPKSVEP